ncbi:hypothetical protein SK128_001887 [Halocaridina rubra]|uniref:Ig-like domain-containing protein n=1 Tax=Halocaridina rubra TaxID=373956 RepID=A0AAN8WKN1_HALRR
MTKLVFVALLGLALGTGTVFSSDDGHEVDTSGNDVQMLFVGYPLKLTCNFTSAEGTAVTLDWYKGVDKLQESDRVKIFQTNSTLVILNPNEDDVGNYSCSTEPGVSGDQILDKKIHVIYLDLKKMDKSRNVDEKESIVLECPCKGIPHPTIHWLKDGKPIGDQNESRIALGTNEMGMFNGTLTINNSQWGDRGNYSCVVTTLLQSYEKWTFLRVKDMYAALWPFIGIVIEVVVLGIVIIIFEKRRAKAEFDESDTDQGNDQ